MVVLREKTVASYVTENIKTAHIFKKYGIDFCCSGNISVEEACNQYNVSYITLEQELSKVDVIKDVIEDYNKWGLDFLMIYIENTHHVYIRESIPILIQCANNVATVHGKQYPYLLKIAELLREMDCELTDHLRKEEKILFPYIKQLITFKKENKRIPLPPFQTIHNPIRVMETEHHNSGSIFKTLKELTNNFTAPSNASTTWKVLYAKLEEFEQDLYKHIHLENNILQPKAIALENDILLNHQND